MDDILKRYQRFVTETARSEYDQLGSFNSVDGQGNRSTIHIPVYASLGLAGETGEFVELIKKWCRDPAKMPDRQKMLSELGDIQWYLTRVANQLGLDLEEILRYNTQKLTRRRELGKEATKDE